MKALLGENLIANSSQKATLVSGVSTQSADRKAASERSLASSNASQSDVKNGGDMLSVSASAVSLSEDNADAVSNAAGTGEGQDEKLEESIREKSDEQLEKLAEEVSKKLDKSLQIRFDQDEESGVDFFQLVEKKSGEIIRQFPPEEFIEIAKNNREITNLLFSEQA